MIAWSAIRRATLLVPSGPAHDPDRLHLHIVLNDPFDFGDGIERVLVVSVCSIPTAGPYDPSCSLFPGEHEFISKHSYVAYQFADLSDPSLLEQKVKAGKFKAKRLLEEKVFAHVLEGLEDSPRASLKVKKFLRAVRAAGG